MKLIPAKEEKYQILVPSITRSHELWNDKIVIWDDLQPPQTMSGKMALVLYLFSKCFEFCMQVYGPRNDGESELYFFAGIANAIS